MAALAFPPDFLWGAATAAYQVEGDNTHSDWWEWERRPGTPCAEPSGNACEHYTRYPQDLDLVAALGLGAYRFSVEWARVEPEEDAFDPAALRHYWEMLEAVRARGLTPVVTLHHFTLPRWIGARGGWTHPETPARFERYCRRVLAALGPGVPWYCTINEPAVLATGGYLGRWGFPPNTVDVRGWRRAVAGLALGHRRAMDAVRALSPGAKVGMALFTCERAWNAGGRALADLSQRVNEELFHPSAAEGDFLGLQTYTRFQYRLPRLAGPLVRAAAALRPLEPWLLPRLLRLEQLAPPGARTTQMGWEYRPEALAEVVRRYARRFPGKELLVTEHGVATADDAERVEFLVRGLAALHAAMREGAPVRGYVHWSLLDNFEWAAGYRMTFGLVGVDRRTQARIVRPSARLLGEVSRTGRLTVPDGPAAAPSAPARAAPAARS